jgi:hypothetical protein
MPWYKADAVRWAHLDGKKTAIKIESKNKENVQIIVLENILYIAEIRLIIKTSPFFYE